MVQLEHLFLASNERTSNIEPNRDFTIFTKLLIEQTRTSVFENQMNSNMFSFLLIELEHPIFGFEWSNIELQT